MIEGQEEQFEALPDQSDVPKEAYVADPTAKRVSPGCPAELEVRC